MTARQKNRIKITRFDNFTAFKVTRYFSNEKIEIKPGVEFLAEKLGIGPGCQISGLGKAFLCVETIEEIKGMMQVQQPQTVAEKFVDKVWPEETKAPSDFVKIDEVTGDEVIGFDRVLNKLGL